MITVSGIRTNSGVRVSLNEDGEERNLPMYLDECSHSPGGFEFGYNENNPTINTSILADYVGDTDYGGDMSPVREGCLEETIKQNEQEIGGAIQTCILQQRVLPSVEEDRTSEIRKRKCQDEKGIVGNHDQNPGDNYRNNETWEDRGGEGIKDSARSRLLPDNKHEPHNTGVSGGLCGNLSKQTGSGGCHDQDKSICSEKGRGCQDFGDETVHSTYIPKDGWDVFPIRNSHGIEGRFEGTSKLPEKFPLPVSQELGCLQLSFAVLRRFVDRETAWKLHQDFKADFVSCVEGDTFSFDGSDIQKWIANRI